MIKRFVFSITLFAFIGIIVLSAQPKINYKSPDEKVPVDPKITIGKLDNGLTYYIKENKKPENRAELFLVVDAGATLEDDDQDGLAHFCEHMAFNGTKNFPKQELIDYLESIGVKFGPDLNAFTSYEQTVYMLHIPTDDKGQFDKGFQVIEDWSHNMLFDHEEIDKERGVILEEWRLGKGADDRIWKKHEKVIYKDSRYSERDVIGDTNVIKNAPYDNFTRFYRDWYRPNLMAVIAIGDFDKNEIEKKIKQHFSKLKNPDKVRERTRFELPAQKGINVSIAQDKELAYPNVRLSFRHPHIEPGTFAEYKYNITSSLATSMLATRLEEYMRKPNTPFSLFVYAYEGRGLAKTREFSIIGYTRGDAIKDALDVMMKEAFRAKQHGFTQTELDRAKEEAMLFMEKAYNERDKTESRNYAMEFMRNFLQKESIPGIEYEIELYKKWLPEISLDEVNKLYSTFITEDNGFIVISAPERDDVVVPGEDNLIAMFREIKASNLAAYDDDMPDKPLFSKKPVPGTIINEKEIKELGVTELTLSNGIKVVLNPTDFKNDEILFRSYSPGGTSLVSDADFMSASAASSIMNESGVGEFTTNQLNKILAGKYVNVYSGITEEYEYMNGNSNIKDLETMFQLVNLKFTAPRIDEEAFAAYKAKMISRIKDSQNDPDSHFYDSINTTLYNYHFRRMPITEDRLKLIDMNKAYEFYKERFSDASDFTFFFTGNFDKDEIKPLINTYLGSLPATNRKEQCKDIGSHYCQKPSTKKVYKGIEEKSSVRLIFTGDFDWNYQNRYYLNSLMDAMDIRLREVIREDKGGSYGVGAWAYTNDFPKKEYAINISFGCDPQRVDELVEAAISVVDEFLNKPLDDKYMVKLKETQKRSFEEDKKDNRKWQSWLWEHYYYNFNPKLIVEKPQMAEKLNATDIHNVAKKYLNKDKMIKVVLYPEAKAH